MGVKIGGKWRADKFDVFDVLISHEQMRKKCIASV